MATPTPEMIGIYYASKNLDSNGFVIERTVGTNSTAMSFTVENIDEPSDVWNGAIGFFVGGSSLLLGQTFHVRYWNKDTNTVTLSTPLPAIPAAGDKFVMFAGGKEASDREVLCMKLSGKQPEIQAVAGSNVSSVTIKKVSPVLGEGTLTLYYTNSNGVKSLQIRMGTSGNYGPSVAITEDMQGVVLFAPDLVGYIVVDVVYGSLSTSSSRTDTFTVTAPKGNMIPNFEGYETNDGIGRTRYHLFAVKNKATNPEYPVSGMMLWTGKPSGTATTCSNSYSVPITAAQAINVADASAWPTRGFWVRNKTANNGNGDLRYVDYRSGNTLYTKPVIWGTVDFKNGQLEIKPGMTVVSSQNATYTAVVDQVVLTSGSWETGDATGTLVLKDWTTSFNFTTGYNINVDGQRAATPSATSIRGYRDHAAATWSSGHVVEPASDLDIGLDIPDENGLFKDPVNENIAPDGVAFGHFDSQANSVFAGPIMAGESVGIWVRQTILNATQARENIEGDLNYEWY